MRFPVASPRLRRLLRVVGPVLLIGLLAGCLLPPEPKTDAGRDVFNLYVVLLVLAGIVFVGVEGFILYAIVRYRRAPGDEELPPQHHGNTLVEIIWTAIPAVIVLILFVVSMFTLATVEARADEPGVTIDVEGFQWNWTFHYPDGVTTGPGSVDEPPVLAVPVGEPVRLRLTALDVIHAFYVPEFLIKRDLVPVGEDGTPNELQFTVTEPGRYAGQCAEFCGSAHAQMTFVVEAMTREEYDAWYTAALTGETPPPPAEGECGTPIAISAASLAFDVESFEAPGGEAFCIEFTNDDTLLHDVDIRDGDTVLFDGETIEGGQTTTYLVPALEAGDYEFFCSVHPEMVGDVTITQ